MYDFEPCLMLPRWLGKAWTGLEQKLTRSITVTVLHGYLRDPLQKHCLDDPKLCSNPVPCICWVCCLGFGQQTAGMAYTRALMHHPAAAGGSLGSTQPAGAAATAGAAHADSSQSPRTW